MMRKKISDLVIPTQGKLLVYSSVSGNWKHDLPLQRELKKMLIKHWNHWKSSTMHILRWFKDWHIGMDTDDRWWVMGKVGGGGGREVKVRDASAILNGR